MNDLHQSSLDELLPALPAPAPAEGKIHDFHERLAWSEAASHEPFWDAVYREAFPNLVGHMLLRGDTASQRQGNDRLLHLANGKTIYVDEKKRDRWDDSDILLEYEHEYHDKRRPSIPGWIEKDLSIDYLAYAFIPLKRVYLFPWPLLRLAWQQHKYEWRAAYPPISSPNSAYITHCTPVPTRILRGAVAGAAKIQL